MKYLGYIKGRRGNITVIILVLIVLGLIGYFMKVCFNEPVSDITMALTAVAGALAIGLQLKKEHDISRADFIFNLNKSFAESERISYVYNKLKKNRDEGNVDFTTKEGREMGDYTMYFEVMGYMVDKNIISIKMVDELFCGRFFLYVNNKDVQKHQLQYSGVMPKLFELYCTWYNHRISNGLDQLYAETHALHETQEDYFMRRKRWWFWPCGEKKYLKVKEGYYRTPVPKDHSS